MSIDFYYAPPSPPCRAVLLVAKAIGLDLNLKICNILAGEHMDPEYIKLNPQHTVPTMVDDGLVVWESRPIMAYLVDQYSKDDSLYPKDPRARLLVDHRMYFDACTLYARYLDYFALPAFSGGSLDDAKKDRLDEALGWFNTMVEGMTFAAGDNLTIADISLVVTISMIDVLKFDLTPYPNIEEWYQRTKEALEPYDYESINQEQAVFLGGFFASKLGIE